MIERYADHSANERTFLAWVRTGIAVMAFGFLVEKFNLFLAYLAQAAGHPPSAPAGPVHAEVLGVLMLLAGVEGCLKYNDGPFQYTQAEMWARVFLLIPGLLRNHLRRGRYLDVFVTHAPPAGIHDGDDLPHRGIRGRS